MKLVLANHSGFCMGVKRAVDTATKLANTGVYVLGEIIHNENVVKDLEKKGLKTVNDISELSSGDTVIIRSHGVPKRVLTALNEKGVIVKNLTCPFVIKTQKIVEDYFL